MSGAVFLWRELWEREEIKEGSKYERRKRGAREGGGDERCAQVRKIKSSEKIREMTKSKGSIDRRKREKRE